MSLPFPRTTCDVYRPGNAPPATPDVAAVPCVLDSAWERGREAGEGENANLRFTHILRLDRAADVRDGFDAWTQGEADTVYIPDRNGAGFAVRFVELEERGSALALRRAYLDRQAVEWPFPAPAAGSGPAGHWKLDDGAGTSPLDSSGIGNDGTLIDGPTWVAGDAPAATGYSACLEFDGVDDHVAVAASSAFDLTGDFTVALWAKWADDGEYQIIGQSVASGNDQPKWILGRGVITPGFLEFHINGPGLGDGVEPIAFEWTPTASTWQHLAVTRAGDDFTLYIDGDEEQSAEDATTITHVSAALRFGKAEGGPFNGRLSDVRLYRRALSAAEILSLVTTGSP